MSNSFFFLPFIPSCDIITRLKIFLQGELLGRWTVPADASTTPELHLPKVLSIHKVCVKALGIQGSCNVLLGKKINAFM